jgi:hypothetical protein
MMGSNQDTGPKRQVIQESERDRFKSWYKMTLGQGHKKLRSMVKVIAKAV